MNTKTNSPTPYLPLAIQKDRESGRPAEYDVGFLNSTYLLVDPTGFEVGAIRATLAPAVVSAVNSHASLLSRVAELEACLATAEALYGVADRAKAAGQARIAELEAALRDLVVVHTASEYAPDHPRRVAWTKGRDLLVGSAFDAGKPDPRALLAKKEG